MQRKRKRFGDQEFRSKAQRFKRRRNARAINSLESLEPRHLLAAQLVINEVMFNASSGQDADEWIEIHNAGDAAANLQGFELTAGVQFTFGDVSIGAGEFLVVAADVERFRTNYPDATSVVGGWTGRLSNSSESCCYRTSWLRHRRMWNASFPAPQPIWRVSAPMISW